MRMKDEGVNGFPVDAEDVEKSLDTIGAMENPTIVPTVSEYYKLNLSEPFKTARGTKYRFIQNGRYYDKQGVRMCGDHERLVISKRSRQPFSTPSLTHQAGIRGGRSLDEFDIVPYRSGYAFIDRRENNNG